MPISPRSLKVKIKVSKFSKSAVFAIYSNFESEIYTPGNKMVVMDWPGVKKNSTKFRAYEYAP